MNVLLASKVLWLEYLASKSLTSLTLMYAHVTSELLGHLLSNCPLLERLHVAYSEDPMTLKICDLSLGLKYLNIKCCFEFKSIEIFAPNLESFGLSPFSRCTCWWMWSSELCTLSSFKLPFLMLEFLISSYQNMESPKFQTLAMALIGFISIIKVAPFLQKIALELLWAWEKRN